MPNTQQEYNDTRSQADNVFKQYQSMGDLPDFKNQITQLYDTPVLRPLVNERAGLESQYLPSLFDPFTKMGTGASDMSPAAKLSLLGGSLGRLTSRIGANQGIQNYYGAQIDNLAETERGKFQDKRQNFMTQYDVLNNRAGQLQQQLQSQRARAAQNNSARTQADQYRRMQEIIAERNRRSGLIDQGRNAQGIAEQAAAQQGAMSGGNGAADAMGNPMYQTIAGLRAGQRNAADIYS